MSTGDFRLSAAELPPERSVEIEEVLESRLGTAVKHPFERAPEMAWGIELRGNGQRIGWNSETYLDSLEEQLKNRCDSGCGDLVHVAG